MPDVSYYLGRPARFWITLMSGAARNGDEPGRRQLPGQPETRRAGRAANDAARIQRPGSHGCKH